MEYNLPGVRPGVDNQAIAGVLDAFLLRYLARHGEQVTDERLISGHYLVDRCDMAVRHHEYMRRCGRVDIAESSGELVGI